MNLEETLERKAGVLAHITSLPSPYGIGDLGKGAYDFVDFLTKANQGMWQILPIGPTSIGDSPYQSFSVFAGNTLFISPQILMEQNYLTEEDLKEFPRLNSYKIQYNKVIVNKTKIFKKAYEGFKQNASYEQMEAYKNFCNDSFWLEDFALFMALKDYFFVERKHNFDEANFEKYRKANLHYLKEKSIKNMYMGAVWISWDEDIKNREEQAIKKWKQKLEDEINYFKFLQYEFFRQWYNLKSYANSNNIKIIGDIPIFVSMDSADVWIDRRLYHLDENGNPKIVSGVPPDDFSRKGQLWGNPIYSWEEHKKDDFEWWVRRIKANLKHIDILRIDHFIGFVRNWALSHNSLNAIKGEWIKAGGFEFFQQLRDELGELPIIVEDLGKVTKGVVDLRLKNNFTGMKLVQFDFYVHRKFEYKYNYENTNYVIYSGTHDNDTSFGWYEKTTPRTQRNIRKHINFNNNNICWDIIEACYSSNAKYAIIPFQDLMELNSHFRTNTPGTSGGNWQPRYSQNMLTDQIAEKLFELCKKYDR